MRNAKNRNIAQPAACFPLGGWLLMTFFLGGASLVQADGTFHDRLNHYLEELAASPNNPEILLRMADLYNEPGEHGDWKIALNLADRVDQIAPGKWPTDFVRASAWIQSEKWANARKELDHYLERFPLERKALVLRGRSLDHLGEGDACLADFRAAMWKTGSPDPEIVQETAFFLEKYRQPDEALAVLDYGISQIGEIPSLVTAALETELRLQRWDAALSRVMAMRAAAQRPEPWMARCAEILMQAGRLEDAKTAWELLVTDLQSLPPPIRQSHSMMLLLEKALGGLKNLENPPGVHRPTGA